MSAVAPHVGLVQVRCPRVGESVDVEQCLRCADLGSFDLASRPPRVVCAPATTLNWFRRALLALRWWWVAVLIGGAYLALAVASSAAASSLTHQGSVDVVLPLGVGSSVDSGTPTGSLATAASPAVAAAAAAPNASATTTVNATLSEMKITVDRSSVPAGSVTFHVTNAGTVTHELVLLQTDLRYDQLPPDPQEPGKVLENEGSTIVHVGETDDMAAGATKDFTVTVAPGKYVLLCNQPGHYASGMRLAFTVQ